MDRKSIRRICWGGILISAIILMMQVQHTETSRYTAVIERSNLDLEEMEVTDYNPTKLKDEVQQFLYLIKQPSNEAAVCNLYDEMLAEIDQIATLCTLNDMKYHGNVHNEIYKKRNRVLNEMKAVESDEVGSAVYQGLCSKYYKEVLIEHIQDASLVQQFATYKKRSKEELQLLKEEMLIQQYNEIINKEESDEKQLNKKVVPIFLELVKNRKQQAKCEGYENYADYAYEKVGNIISQMNPELMETLEYMQEHHLCDIAYDENKAGAGVSEDLYSYQEPVMFVNLGCTYYDYEGFMHEFGHCNYMYHTKLHYLSG